MVYYKPQHNMAAKPEAANTYQVGAAERTRVLPTSPEPGPSSVDNGFLADSHEPTQAQSLHRISRRSALIGGVLFGLAATSPSHLPTQLVTPDLTKTVNRKDGIGGFLLRAAATVFSPKSAEAAVEATAELPTGLLTFTDSLGRKREWKTRNAESSIFPNEEVRGGTVTIWDTIDGAVLVPFQAARAKYPESNIYSIASPGQIIDISTGKFYMPILIRFNENTEMNQPRVEIGDINNPTDYSKHQLVSTESLPKSGIMSGMGGIYSAFKLGSDSNGKYLEVGIKNCMNSSENGIYRIRLATDGLPASIWIKAEATSRKLYLPITFGPIAK